MPTEAGNYNAIQIERVAFNELLSTFNEIGNSDNINYQQDIP